MTKDSLHDGGDVPNTPWRSQALPGGDKKSSRESFPWRNVAVAAVPHVATVAIRAFLGVTVALYILNQKHVLPRPLSAFVSKTLFWPTLPITVSRRIGKWTTRIDDTVVMGGAPFGFLDYPERLYNDFGVRTADCQRDKTTFDRPNSYLQLLFLARSVALSIFVKNTEGQCASTRS